MYNTSRAAKGVAGDHNFSTIRNELDEAISVISVTCPFFQGHS